MADFTPLLTDDRFRDDAQAELDSHKIFRKKFGRKLKSEDMTLNFLIDNDLVDTESDARKFLSDIVGKKLQYNGSMLMSSNYFVTLVQMKSSSGDVGYKLKKYSEYWGD